MIHNVLVFSKDGSVLYSWESMLALLKPTNNVMLSGFFNSVQNILADLFKDKLQKVILEDRVLISTGTEVKKTTNNSQDMIILTITADYNDNSFLLKKCSSQILSCVTKALEKKEIYGDKVLDSKLDQLLDKKIYHRTRNKLIISSVFAYLASFFSSFIYSIIYNETNLNSFLIGIGMSFLLIFSASIIAGNRKNSIIIGIIFTVLGSLTTYLLITFLITSNDTIGTPIIFFGFSLFIGFISGLISGTLMERYFLV